MLEKGLIWGFQPLLIVEQVSLV